MVGDTLARPKITARNLQLGPDLIESKFRLWSDEVRQRLTCRSRRSAFDLFSLDLHISVTPDVAEDLRKHGLSMLNWSISSHNHLLPRKGNVPDPVAAVNAWTWRDLSHERIARFKARYETFLKCFRGFVVTHTPSFVQLFTDTNRPILLGISTRYEDPYTFQAEMWTYLNGVFTDLSVRGKLTAFANNRGDADYFRAFTGIEVPVIPSLCERVGGTWRGDSTGDRYILARGSIGIEDSLEVPEGVFVGLPNGFTWNQLLESREVFVIPQNISTMLLFELATAGIPVAVPSPSWLKQLASENKMGLRELTFGQLHERLPALHSESEQLNWSSDGYLDWWLERADFYDAQLMPNIRVVHSLEQILMEPSKGELDTKNYLEKIEKRNSWLSSLRRDFFSTFARAI